MGYMVADARHPLMGLGNKTCRQPEYWCRLHRVWLSGEDVQRKKCREKQDFDMLGTHRCSCLERKIAE